MSIATAELSPHALHQKTEIKVFRRIEEIPEKDWCAVYPDVVENYHFYRTLDDSGFEQFSFYYIMGYRGGEPVAAAPCFLMTYGLDTTVQGILKTTIQNLAKLFPSLFNLKVLICGLPMGRGKIGMTENHPEEIIPLIYHSLESLAQQEKAAVIAFKDFDIEDSEMLHPLEALQFHRFENFPTTEMPVSFDHFEGYLKSLGRASREGLKRKFKKAAQGAKINLEVTSQVTEKDLDVLYDLYLQTVKKNDGITFEVAPKLFFKKISESMPEKTKYFLWRIDGKLAGFALCFVQGNRFIDYYLGFDYSLAFQYGLYFHRFRELMVWCIENKMEIYEMGPTSYEVKRRMGFQFIKQYVYFKHRTSWLNSLFKYLAVLLKPENFDSVLKQINKEK